MYQRDFPAAPIKSTGKSRLGGTFEELEKLLTLRRCLMPAGHTVAYRECWADSSLPKALPLVLLHGIGSNSASWVKQLHALGQIRRALAWDAPGYGGSSAVVTTSPSADDYADVLREWLDAMRVKRCVLVGHSLGALMAARLATRHGRYIAGLMLLSPAAGHGPEAEPIRTHKRAQRLTMLAELGTEEFARSRSAGLLSPYASQEALSWVQRNMAQIVPEGYAQAARLLENGDLASDVAMCGTALPLRIAVGQQDSVTTPDACANIARVSGRLLQIVRRAGHAGYVEAPGIFTAIIEKFCTEIDVSNRGVA